MFILQALQVFIVGFRINFEVFIWNQGIIRGEERSNSDIDILVDYDYSQGCVSLFKMGGMLMDLSDLLGRRVDLVDNKGLLDFARPSVEENKILIYERSA